MGRKQTWSGSYVPQNPQKYFGGSPDKITYRSSWEWSCMREFDLNPNVLGWSSETCDIPYFNPFLNRQTVYVPDFVIVYMNKQGKKIAEMIEVKPAKEVYFLKEGQASKSKKDKAAQALNMVKWQAAVKFCAKRGIKFRVMTENDLFDTKRKK